MDTLNRQSQFTMIILSTLYHWHSSEKDYVITFAVLYNTLGTTKSFKNITEDIWNHIRMSMLKLITPSDLTS